MKRRLIVLSLDAMVYEDLEYLNTLPVFHGFLAEGSRVNRMRSIYPTVTYPAHTTMATGVYPNRHGVANNEVLAPGERASDWYWFHDAVKAPDIFDAAKQAGLTTAAVAWPVTGRHPSIDYLVDEYWPRHEEDNIRDVFLRSGTSPQLYERVVRKYAACGRLNLHPEAERLILSCACDIIQEYKPELLMIHASQIDSYRHRSGVFSSLVTYGLQQAEGFLDRLITAAKNAGTYEETDFVVTSDHGQMNSARVLHPNVLLKEAGLICTNPDGSLRSWEAWCKSAGFSVQVFLRRPEDKALYRQVYDLLCSWRDQEVYGVSQVFTTEEIDQQEHLSGDFSFVLETDGCTAFGNDWNRPLVRAHDVTDYRFGRATHGYLPDKGPQPVFLLNGPHAKKGVVLEQGSLVDEAPTFARLLGIDLPNTDGRCMDALLQGV